MIYILNIITKISIKLKLHFLLIINLLNFENIIFIISFLKGN